jgi:hypothetical protein
MTNVCNWWCKTGPVTTDDIKTIHEILATKKKNREFDPTLSSYVPNILKGVKYMITAVYLKNVEGGEQVPYMKVSFLLHQSNQIIQFFLIKQFFFSYSFNLTNGKGKNGWKAF